jgi:hypothetical protein
MIWWLPFAARHREGPQPPPVLKAARIDGVDVRISADEGGIVSSPDKHGAEVTSDGSGADDRGFHKRVPVTTLQMSS